MCSNDLVNYWTDTLLKDYFPNVWELGVIYKIDEVNYRIRPNYVFKNIIFTAESSIQKRRI